MVWIQAATEDGFSLETGGVARDARFRVVAAQRNGGRVTIVRTFPVTCDSPRAQGIGVGPSGWMVCWTHTRDGVTELLMATPAHAPRVIRAGRIWEARLVTLDDGTVLLGLIELEGRRPMLRFYRLTSDGLSAESCGPAIEGAWSVAMAPAGGRSCWLAWDRHSAHRLLAEVGQLDAATGRLARHPLPGSGFATMPSVCPLPGGGAGVAWTEDKAWGARTYDFKRATRLRYAEFDADGIRLCEDVPVPPLDEADDQQSPCSPGLVALHDGVHLLFRRMRTAMRSGTLINDWGWQLHTITRAPDGNWTAPAIFSHDVGLPDEPPRLAATGAGEAMLIYHACSFDAMRSVIHGNRIHLAVLRAAPAAATGVHAPLPPRAVEPANRPRLATRPVTEAAGERLGCYWGDLHRHSHVSKCIPEHDGGFADHARFAVSVRGFDFYSLTDHDTQISDREWEQWLGRCDCLSEAGSMIVIPGFEGPNHTVQGHVNVYFRDREAAAFGYRGMRHLATLPEMYEACRRAGMVNRVVFIRHFHADALRHADLLQGPGVFNPAFNWAMEVVQGRGYSPKTTRILLDAGFRFGFVGGSDHNRPPGHPRGGVGIYEQAITGIWSTALDSQALFESLRLRRTFCTNGPLLGAAIRVNDTFMGGCAPKRAVQAIRIDIQPTTRLQSVALLRDGQPVAQRILQAKDPVSLEFEDAPGDDAAHVYYAVIEQTPEPGLDYPGIAWTSPVWVD